jgi:hypothetical protein
MSGRRTRRNGSGNSNQDALRNQLLKLQIQHANDPSEWKPTTKQEYLDTHPIKPETPRNTDPLSPRASLPR